MPFVTEEIYSNLPVKEKELLIFDSYPKYNKKQVYPEATKEIDELLEFVTLFRNKKKELNIKNFSVVPNIKNECLLSLSLNMLKLNDKLNDENNYSLKQTINLFDLSIDILYNEEIDLEKEKENLLKEKEKLTSSIERRRKLLSNENYVNKAPANVVENDREQLAKEENQLQIIEAKLKN